MCVWMLFDLQCWSGEWR